MNKNIFLRDISIYFLKSFSSKFFYKILREKESYIHYCFDFYVYK